MPKNIEDRYIKLTHKEHIITRPETYIGSIEKENKSVFVAENYDDDIKNTKIVYKEVEYNPGFIKIFDEIIKSSPKEHMVSYYLINLLVKDSSLLFPYLLILINVFYKVSKIHLIF